jgi:hypothetical protein
MLLEVGRGFGWIELKYLAWIGEDNGSRFRAMAHSCDETA